jgi:hypothetical protein
MRAIRLAPLACVCRADCADNVDAGRTAENQALLLHQVEKYRGTFEIRGDAALTDTFGDRVAVGRERVGTAASGLRGDAVRNSSSLIQRSINGSMLSCMLLS